MSVKKSHDASAPDARRRKDEPHGMQGSGLGAASALEKMKAEHALRHKRQHGQDERNWAADQVRNDSRK